MSKYPLRPVTYAVLISAFTFAPAALRADPLPTVNITSATGFAVWGDYTPACGLGVCASLSSPVFALGFGDYVPRVFFNAGAGQPFSAMLVLSDYIGASVVPTGGVEFEGASYPVIYEGVPVNWQPFIVPNGTATVEVPAVLSGTGLACTVIYPLPSGCFPPPGTNPYPVQIANVDLNIPGYLTVSFHPAFGPNQNNEVFVATFTPVPEPSTVFIALAALALTLLLNKKKAESDASQPDNQ